MTDKILLLPILVPFIAGVFSFLIPDRLRTLRGSFVFIAALFNLLLACALFNANITYIRPWFGVGFEFSLRIYHFSAFSLLAVACFGFLTTLYCLAFLKTKSYSRLFYGYLFLTLALVNGAFLADNLLVMLFFWEGTLATLFGMIAIGQKSAFKTASKAFIIVGIADLCMMAGIALTGHLAGTLNMSVINLPLTQWGGLAFVLLMIGAIAKAGSMPFHSWIPDAAVDAPLPFMGFLPAAVEKLLGIYFLARISLDLFILTPGSWVSYMLMIIGALTIILAVMMALVQKDYKRLLSYHAISQAGYMILGIGTAVPAGIVGGLFHMINNAMYKSCLFFTGGSVERQAGTTDLEKLGGLGKKMPITFACFLITAISISGVPPFNGFFSKELVYDGALERGTIFYIAALVGSFLTAASFLKLGHAAFLGRVSDDNKKVKEAPVAMLLPMIVIAAGCALFGLYNALPIQKLIQPILGEARLEGHDYSGMPTNMKLVIVTVIVLVAAILNHLWGVRKTGSGLKAVDHIHYAPVLSGIYIKAEKRYFDPYNLGMKLVKGVSKFAVALDRATDWVYDTLAVKLTMTLSQAIRREHTGNYSAYLGWSLLGAVVTVIYMIMAIKI